MQRLTAFKYRLRPTQAQREYFSRCFGCVRLVYNASGVFASTLGPFSPWASVHVEGGNLTIWRAFGGKPPLRRSQVGVVHKKE